MEEFAALFGCGKQKAPADLLDQRGHSVELKGIEPSASRVRFYRPPSWATPPTGGQIHIPRPDRGQAENGRARATSRWFGARRRATFGAPAWRDPGRSAPWAAFASTSASSTSASR